MKCRQRTGSHNETTLKTANNRLRKVGTCAECGGRKSSFVTKVEVEAVELHKPAIKKFVRRRIVTLGIDDLWAADLVIMKEYSAENDGFKYMLNVIDTFSKYAWSEPLKWKSGAEVSEAFERIIDRAVSIGHKAPNLLHTDKGREFVNKDFRQLMQKYNIRLYHTENEEKSSIVERFNRTLNEKMKVVFEIQKSHKWIHQLQSLMKQYNEVDVHSTIQMSPVEVNGGNERDLLDMYKKRDEKIQWKSPKFKVGDRVRITLRSKVFANKYRANWTREIFTVVSVNTTRPTTYKIQDDGGEIIQGSFYEKELQLTSL